MLHNTYIATQQQAQHHVGRHCNFALTSVRLRIANHPQHFSQEGQRKLLAIAEAMRYELMRGNDAGFDNYVDDLLAREPDAADFLLEDLFNELNITDREELTAKLLES